MDFIPLIRKGVDHVVAKLTVGADHSDFHVILAQRLTAIAIVINQFLAESSIPCSE
jgi:hypothetical protein